MNKPEKKDKSDLEWGVVSRNAYNQCYDEYQEFLPDAKEIYNLIAKHLERGFGPGIPTLSEAIAKRIGR